MKNIDSDLIRGNIDTIILKTMLDGDKYGLDIIKEVESRSNGTYELKQPTLYSCLKRLENQQLISSYWLDSDIGGRRHYYKLTDKGHETLQKKQEEWSKSKFIIDNLLSNYNYDEYRLVKKDDYDKIIEGKQFVYEDRPAPTTAQNSSAFEPQTTADEDYEHVNQDSDLNEFNDLESTAEQETYDSNAVINDYNDEELKEVDFASVEDEDKAFNFGYNQETEEKPTDEETFDFSNDTYGISFDDRKENLLEPSTKRHYFVDSDDEPVDYSYNESEEENDVVSENEQTPETIYFSSNEELEEITSETEEKDISEPAFDQTAFESNILKRLRMQDEEEINTYVGDQKSYVNHLNLNDELDDKDVVQSSMLDLETENLNSDIDETINEFSSAIEELNNFSFATDTDEEDVSEPDEPEVFEDEAESFPEHIKSPVQDDNLLLMQPTETVYDDEFLNELNELNRNKNNGFFNSFDNPDYDAIKQKQEPAVKDTFDFDYNQTDSSDASFDDDSYEDFSSTNNELFNFSFAEEKHEEKEPEPEVNSTNLYAFDQIISNNASSYSTQYSDQSTYAGFTPRFTSENYKQKLSNLSAYSKVTEDEPAQKTINEDALVKAKDIETLKAEFEEEGIKVREFKKYNSHDKNDRTYLLSNKIKMVNSLILLFAYVFVLSAVYIILNNTSFKDSYGFSFKYFLFGFIPFGVYAAYHIIMFCINPYKKVPAKLAPRILIFISLIITVQLLLITYCVNLQLGFYSFTQQQYNHLLWIIPTIISFAPICANAIYITLFYSKNFNV